MRIRHAFMVAAAAAAFAACGGSAAKSPTVGANVKAPTTTPTTTASHSQVCAQQTSPISTPPQCSPADPNYQPFTPQGAGQTPLP